MRHRKAGKQLSRNSSHRRALLRNMVTSLLKHEQIETTDAKAKSIRPVTEKMITLAKKDDLHARRQALAYIQDKAVTHKLFDELKDRYTDKQGGYVRIVKKGIRKGDGAPISIVQLIPKEDEKKSVKKKIKKKKMPAGVTTGARKTAPVKTEETAPEKLQDGTSAAPVADAAGKNEGKAEAAEAAPLTENVVNEDENPPEKTQDDAPLEAEQEIKAEEEDKP